MKVLTLFRRDAIAILFLFACSAAIAGDYPPLPTVERIRLTDEALFEKLDSEYPGMQEVLETLKYAVPEWRTLEIGIWLSGSWTNAFFRFLLSPSMDEEAVREMLKSFWEMGNHLKRYSSLRTISSNWLIYETRGLHTVAILFPEFGDAADWLTLSEDRLTTELTKQVYPDGVQWELAPGYGGGVLKAFRRARRRANPRSDHRVRSCHWWHGPVGRSRQAA
jgi:heparinase II/III-like protein